MNNEQFSQGENKKFNRVNNSLQCSWILLVYNRKEQGKPS